MMLRAVLCALKLLNFYVEPEFDTVVCLIAIVNVESTKSLHYMFDNGVGEFEVIVFWVDFEMKYCGIWMN